MLYNAFGLLVAAYILFFSIFNYLYYRIPIKLLPVFLLLVLPIMVVVAMTFMALKPKNKKKKLIVFAALTLFLYLVISIYIFVVSIVSGSADIQGLEVYLSYEIYELLLKGTVVVYFIKALGYLFETKRIRHTRKTEL